ncbi:MAG: hypothetical protein IJA85_08085 [Clostridia bacterium]|nr:hypothetical protein [Clostridia bacterium]
MNSTGKAVIIILCAVVLFTSSMFGTIAFFTSTDKVETTFTIGKVKVAVTEAKINSNGVKTTDERVMSNKVQMTPGTTYTKDPTVTILAGSESAYVRMIVTINKIKYLDEVYKNIKISNTEQYYSKFNFNHFFDNSVNHNYWEFIKEVDSAEDSSRSFEFRYKQATSATSEDKNLEPLLLKYKIPGEIDTSRMDGFTIKIVAHAIQAAGFNDDVGVAWESFEAQINASSTD